MFLVAAGADNLETIILTDNPLRNIADDTFDTLSRLNNLQVADMTRTTLDERYETEACVVHIDPLTLTLNPEPWTRGTRPPVL